jgi:hypothetical protein
MAGMPQPANRTTKLHFALFKRSILDCVSRWRVTGWDIRFEHGNGEQMGNDKAHCQLELASRICVFRLNRNWGDSVVDRVGDKAIEETARHEAIHLVLAPLTCLIEQPYISKAQEEEANESVAIFLDRLLP